MNDASTFQTITAPPYVRGGERVLWIGKPTLRVIASNVFGFGMFILFGIVFTAGSAARGAAFAGRLFDGLLFAIVILLVGIHALRLRKTEFVITDQGLYTRTGLIGQSVSQTTHDKITDIALKQDILGRVLGYATLHVNTAGSSHAPVQMVGLPRALEVKQRIEQAREAFLVRGRPPAAAPSASPHALPRFTLDEDLMRIRCPTTKRTFKRLKTEAGQRVACPHCGKTHLAKESPRAD
jgi:membrane protein YdbS with pleckstrin-like domain/DNA-directed RNA polymerase subunit RPC12/RpoP